MKVCQRKDHYKNELASLSDSLSDNVDELKKADQIIKDLEKECNKKADSVDIDKDFILHAASLPLS